MRTDLFDYELPPDLIAQTPLPRGESRLLVLHRANGRIEHRRFPDLLSYLRAGDTLVLNDTRVIARRLRGRRASGHEAEVLLLRPVGERQWAALVKPGRSLRPGSELTLLGPQRGSKSEAANSVTARVIGETEEGGRLLEFADAAARNRVGAWGSSPLPPYIHTALPSEAEERYQTVYARHNGSAAAPTAGLHFTEAMLTHAQAMGVAIARVTLHVGVDTFRPVKVEDTDTHKMHGEAISISEEAAQIINRTQGRIIAVGTTSVRALETAALALSSTQSAGDAHSDQHPTFNNTQTPEYLNVIGPSAAQADNDLRTPEHLNTRTPEHRTPRVAPFTGETRLFITPGYTFRAVDALITNFHLPRSTLLMLISALASREYILAGYAEAVQERYRFYSFGDAMLII